MRRSRVFTLLVSAILLLGMTIVYAPTADATPFPHTITGTIEDDVWGQYVGTVEFQEDYEIYFLLTIDDIVPDTDLDFIVYDDEWNEMFWLGEAYGYRGDPDIVEEGYFWAPYSGEYHIYMDGYWVPYEEGVEFTLFINSAEELYNMAPLEAHGLSTGALTSYMNNHPNAMGASEKAPFHDVDGAYEAIHINRYCSFTTNSWTPYSLHPASFCSDDAHIVGGIIWQLPVRAFESFKDAKDWMVPRNFEYYIDGIRLPDAYTKTGSVQKIHENGEVVYYRKVLEYAVFGSGKLAKLIGEGLHKVDVHFVGPGFDNLNMWFYFWLMPEGWTGPH